MSSALPGCTAHALLPPQAGPEEQREGMALPDPCSQEAAGVLQSCQGDLHPETLWFPVASSVEVALWVSAGSTACVMGGPCHCPLSHTVEAI